MKSSQFKRNTAAIRFRREEAKKKKIPWGKVVYLGLFWLLILWLIFFMASRYIMIERMGQIRFPKTEVTVLEAAFLEELHVVEGNEVEEGDPLFRVRYDRPQKRSERNWITRELWDLDSKIQTTRNRITSLGNRLTARRREVTRIEESALLELRDPTRLSELRVAIEDLKLDLAMERDKHAQLKQRHEEISKIPIVVEAQDRETIEEFKAPMRGTITRVAKSESEVIFPGEIVVNIHRQEQVNIRAFFEQDDAGDLAVGDQVQIILPNNRKTQGIITRFYFATFPLPPEFQPRFEPRQRSIVVDIQPILIDDISSSEYFYKMAVKIRKYRNGFIWLGM